MQSHDHGVGHGHGHGQGHDHARMCGGVDHNTGSYTEQQRADLDRVLEFNHRMASAIDAGADVAETEAFLDPDPLRYMWVDEGQGRIAEVITKAHELLTAAPLLQGHVRLEAGRVEGSERATRPSIAVGADGAELTAWIEWVPPGSEVVKARAGGVTSVVAAERDVFRPTAVIAADGTPWVFWSSSRDGRVAVRASRFRDGVWEVDETVSTTEDLSFNQEAVAHPDGRLELVWQGRDGRSFGIWAREYADGAWGEARRLNPGGETNVWDPAIVAFANGESAYAWSEYAEGAYRIVVRHRGQTRAVTSGSDYGLHPHLAVTTDQRLWCAFDIITVAGHGGSGPTKLRPREELSGADTDVFEGMRAPGDSIPPELLPEVSASLRVVEVTEHGVTRIDSNLAAHHDVVPSGLPKLVATDDGGLTVVYRIHRRLPLMTYYWEVATQSLLAEGVWGPATTLKGTDGTLEEASAAAAPDGIRVVAQTDGRLDHALAWTEGFGGRECPYLLEHQGSVIWHGIHGVGAIARSVLKKPGHIPRTTMGDGEEALHEAVRTEARRWFTDQHEPGRRYVADLPDRSYALYWGDLHRHSLVSRCTAGDEPSLEDFYRYAWDVAEYDFWAVTDHSENSTAYQWWTIQKIADLFHVPGRFVPFYGFEWTSADSGHQNVIYGDVDRGAPIFSAFASGTTDPAGLWAALEQYPEFPAITIPHHPGSAMVHNDWDYHDPRFSKLVEIFQACRGNYEGPGAFRQYSDAIMDGTFTIDGLMRGHKFGLIASSDHGHGASYVGAYAENLGRASVFDALQNRRTFAATTRDVIVDVRLGETGFMGEEVAVEGDRVFAVHAEGYAELARIDVVRNGEVVHSVTASPSLPDGWRVVPVRLEWGGSTETTDWDGELTVAGGEVVQTSFVAPELTSSRSDGVTWHNVTHSFGELYGAQRGGIDLSVAGPDSAVVSIRCGARSFSLTLGELADQVHEISGGPGHFRVQPGIGGLTGLGTRRLDVAFTDDTTESAFYYIRVFQIDGEMAWSSPIWVTTTPAGAPV